MTAYAGKMGKVFAGSSPTQIAEVRNWQFQAVGNEIETPVMGTGVSRTDIGPIKTTGTLDLYWDPEDSGEDELTVGDVVALEIYPDDNTTGKTKFTGNVRITSAGIASTVQGMIEQTVTFGVDGQLTEGTVTP